MPIQEVTTAKLANLVSDGQVAFNAGSNAGVQSGDDVVLYKRIEIKDPDTGESLGVVTLPKLNMKVNLVAERYCVAKVVDRVSSPSSGSNLVNRALFAGMKTVTTNVMEESPNCILVRSGEQVRIQRLVPTPDDEPPF